MDATFTDIMVVIMSLMSIIVVVVNSVCIYVIKTSKVLFQKSTSLLILSVLVLHMIQGLFVIPFYAAKKAGVTDLLSKKIVCDGFRFTYMITFYGVCVNVFLISIDRLLAVKLLTEYKTVVTRRRVKYTILFMWVYVLGLCMIPFADIKRSASNSKSICIYNQPREWTIYMLIVNTLIAYVITTASYSYIYLSFYLTHQKARSSSSEPMSLRAESQVSEVNKPGGEQKNIRKRRRASSMSLQKITKITFMIVLTYGFSWAPSIFYYLIVTLRPDIFTEAYYTSALEGYITFFAKFFTFFDAIGAPILYCYFHTDFRNEFKRWLNVIWARRNKLPTTDLESSSNIC